MLAEAEKSNPTIDFNRKFPAAMEVIADQAVVSGTFTKGGWTFMQGVLKNPSPYFSADSWVLGQANPSAAELTQRAVALRRAYQQDYIEH
jgi:type VI secretion system protein ImpL